MTTSDAVPTLPATAPGDLPTWHARAGRLSVRKRWALDELSGRYDPFAGGGDGEADGERRWADPAALGSARGVAVEIGAGTGESAVGLAVDRPDWLVLAAEVHRSSFATMLLAAHDAGVANLWVAAIDGRQLLRLVGRRRPVDLVRVLFPDPWPKRRHRSRRLVNAAFADLLAGCLTDDGTVELATDDDAYARATAAVLGGDGRFTALTPPRVDRPVTYYERRALHEGRTVHDLRFAIRRRVAPDGPDATEGNP